VHIGFDLDNTIICYDSAFATTAVERKYLSPHAKLRDKEAVKRFLYAQDGQGVARWQALQGYVYGRGIMSASLFEGVESTLRTLTSAGHEFSIVSHKTEFGHFDESLTNLRHSATTFLHANNVMEYIYPERIFYCETLQEKIGTIAKLACNVFIDDLSSVLLDKKFPDNTHRVVFRSNELLPQCHHISSWYELPELLEEICK
jgi:hypothetical protein